MKRAGFFIIPLLLLFFTSALAAIQGMDKGQDHYDKQEYQQALTYLLTAFQHSPGDANLNFLLGRTYFELGQYEAAVMAYERVLFAEPESSRVKLEMARTYLALGSKEYARKYFQEVLATNPPEAVWNNIQRFLLSIRESDRQHFFTGTLSLGLDFDDNPRVAPVDDVIHGIPLVGDGSKPDSDVATIVSATANYIYRPLDSKFFWKTSGLTYNAFYSDQSDLDVNYFELSTGPAVKWGDTLWQNTIFATNVDVDNSQYQDSFGLSSTLTTTLLPTLMLTANIRYEDKDNKEYSFRSADNIRFSLNPVLQINPARLSLSFGIESENAVSDIVSYDRFFWQIRVDSPIIQDINLYALFLVKSSDYDEADPIFMVQRHDDYHELGLGLSIPFWVSNYGFQTLVGAVSYKYIDSDSNIELYTYRRKVVSLNCTYAF